MMFLEIYQEFYQLAKDLSDNKGTFVINASEYLAPLVHKNCITISEKETVDKGHTNEERNITLFYQILPAKGEFGLYHLLEVLQDRNLVPLAASLIGIVNSKELATNSMKERIMEIRVRGVEKEKQKLIWFDLIAAVKTFTGRTSELAELHQKVQMYFDCDGTGEDAHVPIVITGMGGVGKTQFMACYIDKYARDNDYNVVWVNAEKHEYLIHSFYRLAEYELNVETNNNQGQKKDIRAIVKEVYKWFRDKKCLFIFDNAEQLNTDIDGDGIIGFLPQRGPDLRSPCIVITSRNQKWGDFELLPLSPLKHHEASKFIKRALKISDDSEDGAIEALSNTLQNLPLTLQQAVSYIKKTNEEKMNLNPDKRFTIRNYLDQYEARAAGTTAVLLKYQFPNDDSANFNLKPTFTTWQTTVDKIKLMQDAKSEFALRLLNICAFCAPSRVPTEQMFLHMVKNDEQLLGESVGLLKQYSLVTTSEGCLSVHRLVQQVTRLVINEEGTTKQVMSDVFTALHGNFTSGDSLAELMMQRLLLPHLDFVRTLIEEMLMENTTARYKSMGFVAKILGPWFGRSNKEKTELEKDHYIPLLDDLCACYYYLRDPGHLIKTLQLQMLCVEKHYGSFHVKMAAVLRNLGNAYCMLGDYSTSKEYLEKALAIDEKSYGPDHISTARTLLDLGNVFGHFGDHQKKKELLERALEIREKHCGPEHSDVAAALVNLGNTYGKLGQPQKKKEMLERALTITEKHYGSEHPEIAIILVNLADVSGTTEEDARNQKKLLERALEITENQYGSDHFEVAQVLVSLGNNYNALGDRQKQKEVLERSLAIEEKFYGSDHVKLSTALTNLGLVHGLLGDLDKQKELLERALAIKENHYGSDHFEVAITLTNLGNAYGDLGDPKKKKELLERALAIKENQYGSDHFEVAITLTNLGNAYGDLGDPKKSKELLERALAIKENHYGSDHFEVAITLTNLGNAYGDLGDSKKSKELFERALAIDEKHYGSDHFEVAATLANLGIAYGDLGDLLKKKELLERALAIDEKHYGSDHFEVAATLVNLGNAYGDFGDPKKKKEFLERALAIEEKHYGYDHYKTALTLVAAGNAYGALGHAQHQKELYEKALPILENHYGCDHVRVGETLQNLGCAYGELGDPWTKKELHERALSILQKHHGPDHFKVASTLSNLGNAYGELGNPQKQKELLEKSLSIKQKHYGSSDNFELAAELIVLASVCGELGDHLEQKELLERALSINEKHYGCEHVQVSEALENLGNAYGALGDFGQQKQLLERALTISEKHHGPQHFETVTTLIYLADAHGKLGDPEKRIEIIEMALDISVKHYGCDHIHTANVLANLGLAYEATMDYVNAKFCAQRALNIFQKCLGIIDDRVMHVMRLLVRLNYASTV